MSSRTATSIRKNEDEKHEKIIRSLAKLPENRRCINCGSMGPQYICTNFATFVCTACSGVHREFTHRIKSISMAKFTPEEVHALQDGGNDRAREIFFRDLDPHKFPLPDPGNPDKLREFIKNVYIERRYTGERTPPPRRSDRDDARRPSPRRSSAQPSEVRSPRLDGSRGSRYEEQMPEQRRTHESRNSYDGGNDREGRFMGSPASVYSAPATISSDRGGGHRRSAREGSERDRHDDRDGREHRSARHEREHRDRGDRGDRDRDRDRERHGDDRYDPRGGGDERREGRRSTRGIDEYGSPPMQPVSAILGDGYATKSGRHEEDYNAPVQQKRSSRRSKTPTRDGHQRVNSGNLIDWNAMDDPPPAVPAPAVDPFGGAGLSAPAAAPVDNGGGWATFGGAGMTAAGAAPAPTSFDSTASFGGSSFVAPMPNGAAAGWGAFGPPQQPVPQQPAPMGGTVAGGQWSLFGAVPGQAAAPMPQQQQWAGFPGSQQPVGGAPPGQFPQQPVAPAQHPQPQAPQPQPQPPQPQAPLSSQGPPSSTMGRQEIPEDFFAQPPSFGAGPGSYSSAYGQMGMGPPSYQGPPSYTAPAPGPPPGQHKTKNPFDLPGDSPPPGPSPAAFPNMAPLQSALPNYQAGPFSNPAPPPGPPSSGNWAAAAPPGMNFGPASYPGNAAAAGFATGPGPAPASGFSQPSAFQQPSMGVNSLNAAGSFSGAPPSSFGGMQSQYGMPPQQQYSQQMPIVGNPFG